MTKEQLEQWNICEAVYKLVSLPNRNDQRIADYFGISVKSVGLMFRAWAAHNAYKDLIGTWPYATVAAILPVSNIRDFIEYMNITDIPSSREAARLVAEYKKQRAEEAAMNEFWDEIKNDNYVKIDGHYIRFSPEEKKPLCDLLGILI